MALQPVAAPSVMEAVAMRAWRGSVQNGSEGSLSLRRGAESGRERVTLESWGDCHLSNEVKDGPGAGVGELLNEIV